MKRHRCSAFLGLLVSGYVSCREMATGAISGLSPEVTGLKPSTRTITPLMQARFTSPMKTRHEDKGSVIQLSPVCLNFVSWACSLYLRVLGVPEFPSLAHSLMDVHCCILCQRLQHHIALNRSKEKSFVEADEVKQQQLKENCYLSRRFSYTAQSNPYGLLPSFDLRFLFYRYI